MNGGKSDIPPQLDGAAKIFVAQRTFGGTAGRSNGEYP
jgi:hypothetical protein